jgi:hypothetical protein
MSAHFGQLQCFLVKSQTFFQIQYVKVIVGESKLHSVVSSLVVFISETQILRTQCPEHSAWGTTVNSLPGTGGRRFIAMIFGKPDPSECDADFNYSNLPITRFRYVSWLD